MERTPGKKGRPEGRVYPHVRMIRLSDKDKERLERLSEKHELPEVQIVRTAIRRMAEEDGVEASPAD